MRPSKISVFLLALLLALGLARRVESDTSKNWGICKTETPEAQKIVKSTHRVVVAVVDTGIDGSHPIFHGQVLGGWDVAKQTKAIDEHGHGTHVAGIIAQINPNTVLLPIKYYDDNNSGAVNTKNSALALEYAVTRGAEIINYSGGGPEFSEAEYLALKRAEARGILVVVAAGNEHSLVSTSKNQYYPCAYHLKNMICVAATDPLDVLILSSNWGPVVDVAAPGENMYSSLLGGGFGYMTGTSQATAFVTGIASLLLSERPGLTPREVKSIIVKSVDRLPSNSLKRPIATQGRVNTLRAVELMRKKFDVSKKTQSL
jgi:subtilisin family serine protease